MWRGLVILIWLSVCLKADICKNEDLRFELTACTNNETKAVFYWANSQCTNQLPPPTDPISCTTSCPAGTYLGVEASTRKLGCVDCPENTYSTGSTLRLSSTDYNWNEIPKEAQTLCYWTNEEGYWRIEPCRAFLPNQDNTALIANMAIAKPNTWNIMEFKLNVYLLEEGEVKFVFRKTSTVMGGVRNGRFRFDMGFYNYLHEDDPTVTGLQVARFPLKKGLNELMWYFAFTTASDVRGLGAELSQIEISPVRTASLMCLPCRHGYSQLGAKVCISCPANQISDAGSTRCLPCPDGTMAYPGDVSCRQRPACHPDYDAEPIFGECINGQRVRKFRWRAETICNTAASALPAEAKVQCAVCRPGFYTGGSGGLSPDCRRCAEGDYSSEDNSLTCKRCPSGNYAPVVQRYDNLEQMPSGFTMRCETLKTGLSDLCAFHKGWVVAQKMLTTLPSLPAGIRVFLHKTINVTRDHGQLEFTYKVLTRGTDSDPSETLKLRVDASTEQLSLKEPVASKLLQLSPGVHKIDWIYERHKDAAVVPLAISSIRIEGESGSSDTCLRCPYGRFSPEGSTFCHVCPWGTEANANGTHCETCPFNMHRTLSMNSCQLCPNHTHPGSSRATCTLYDAYDFNGYMFNFLKFDSRRNISLSELKDLPKVRRFLGPFPSNTTLFFFSLAEPLPYDIDSYEYEESSSSILEGHVFGLFAGAKRAEASSVRSHEPVGKLHYREKINLGARLHNIDTSRIREGEVTLEYGSGDISAQGRHNTRITLICDKTVQSLTNITYKSQKVNQHHFVWRTPYACRQCSLPETAKYIGQCAGGVKSIYLEEGPACILHKIDQNQIAIERVRFNNVAGSLDEADTSAQYISQLNASYGQFVYFDEYLENCSEMELPSLWILILVAVFIVLVAVAIAMTVMTCRYKNKYQQLLDEKIEPQEMKDAPKNRESLGKP